jgi:hypothetical protein
VIWGVVPASILGRPSQLLLCCFAEERFGMQKKLYDKRRYQGGMVQSPSPLPCRRLVGGYCKERNQRSPQSRCLVVVLLISRIQLSDETNVPSPVANGHIESTHPTQNPQCRRRCCPLHRGCDAARRALLAIHRDHDSLRRVMKRKCTSKNSICRLRGASSCSNIRR